MISYLVKYVTEKESRAYVNFNTGDKQGEINVDNINTDHVNEKITGVKIINKEKNKYDFTHNNNVMEVFFTEVCHNILKCNYAHCNATFVHINTFPPEYRKSLLKPNFVRKIQMQQATVFEPNSYRQHIPQPWRTFSHYQIDHAKEYLNSSINYWGAVEEFNLRPPELKIFSNLLIFT